MDYARLRGAVDAASETVEQVAGQIFEYTDKLIEVLETLKEYLPEDKEPQAPVADAPDVDPDAPLTDEQKLEYVIQRMRAAGTVTEATEATTRTALQKSPKVVALAYDAFSHSPQGPVWGNSTDNL